MGAYSLAPLANIVVPLLGLPSITSSHGAAGWASIAIGQSVGGVGAVLVALGWDLTGPQRAARRSSPATPDILRDGIRTKLLALIVVAIPIAVGAFALGQRHPLSAGTMALATTTTGLTSSWYFVGRSQPLKVLWSDAVPKVVAVAVGSLLLLLGMPLVTYPLLLVIAALCGVAITARMTRIRLSWRFVLPTRRSRRLLHVQLGALGARAVSSLYIALPISLVAIVAPAAVPGFAAVERLQRMALAVLQTTANFHQGWIGAAPNPMARFLRMRRAAFHSTSLGLVVGVLFATVLPIVVRLLFSNSISIPWWYGLFSGALIIIVMTSRITGGIGLVLRRDIVGVGLSAAAGAVVGLPLILLFASVWTTPGALLAEVVAEAVVLSIQLARLQRRSPHALAVREGA